MKTNWFCHAAEFYIRSRFHFDEESWNRLEKIERYCYYGIAIIFLRLEMYISDRLNCDTSMITQLIDCAIIGMNQAFHRLRLNLNRR